jgi:hypothetical protein
LWAAARDDGAMLSEITDAAALHRTELLQALALPSHPGVDLAALGLRRSSEPPTGAWLLEGIRHGRRVRIDVGQGLSVTTVGTPSTVLRAIASGGRLHVQTPAAAAVRDALEPLGPSPRWTDLEAVGGGEGVMVARRSQTGDSWPYDLWLAERLIGALSAASRHWMAGCALPSGSR